VIATYQHFSHNIFFIRVSSSITNLMNNIDNIIHFMNGSNSDKISKLNEI